MKAIDVHVHYGKWFLPIESIGIDDLLRIMEKNEIEKSILSSSLAIVYDFREGNADLCQAIEGHKELWGYVFLNPNYEALSLQEMEKYSSKENFVGIKLYGNGYINQSLDCDAHKRFLETLARKFSNKVALIHCWGKANISRMISLANEFSNLTFIMGHMGGSDWKDAILSTKNTKNIYLETCSTPQRAKIEEAVQELGAERILFGSDSTLLNPARYLAMVEEAEITNAEKQKILYDNARKMFNF